MRAKSRHRKGQPESGAPRKRQRTASRRDPAAALEMERQRRRDAERSVRELEKAAADRSRAARELVDSMLQRLYAVGLGVEASRTMLAVNPQRASRALTHATDQLNDVIHRLRAYLVSRVR